MISGELPFSSACERNKGPILDVLCKVLPASGTVLEIGSGTGQHVEYFSSRLPLLVWQPSDRPEYLAGLKSRLEREARVNVLPAIELDVLDRWPAGPFDAVYSANTAHIMSWAAVCAMFEGVGSRLPEGGVFCLYGPFNLAGSYTAPSNAAFDAQLRREDPQMGLRDVDDLEVLAGRHHLALRERVALPANNQLLIFTHRGGSGNHD